MEDAIKWVKEEIERRRSELISLTSELIKFKTVVPPGETRDCVEYIRSYFDEAGIETKIYERRRNKANISAEVQGELDGRILWLGHLDVVPEGSHENWSYNPFGGEVVGNRIYGRGSSDMKGSCASAMVAAKVLSLIEEHCHPTVEFWFTCDEEVGAVDGARWLAEKGIFRGEVCIIGDSFGSFPEAPWVDVGCKGYLRIRLLARGKTAHGSVPFMGDNAIDKLIRATEYVRRVSEYPLSLPDEIKPLLESSTEFLLEEKALNDAQKEAASKIFYYPSVSLNLISGGVKINVVPDLAEASFDIRITPGASIEDVKQRALKLLEESSVEGVEASFSSCGEGYYEPPDSPAVERMVEAVRLAVGVKPRLKILTGGTDGIFVRQISGIPSVGFGAGVRGTAHSPNEYVTIENLIMAAKTYAVFPLIWRS